MVNAGRIVREHAAMWIAAPAAAGLFAIGIHDYLLFHSLAELFSIVVGCCIFLIAWNAREFIDSHYFLVLGPAYLFVCIVEAAYALTVPGMATATASNANHAAQLWVSARCLESASLVLAFALRGSRPKMPTIVAAYAVTTGLVLAAVFAWRVFPECYRDGLGLTGFKVASEHVVVGVFGAAMWLLWRRRSGFEGQVFRWLACSIGLSMLSEVALSRYVSPHGPINVVGHLLKLASFYLIYRALIETGLRKPYAVLFRQLKQSEEQLQAAHARLEVRVKERTAELADTVGQLQREVGERIRAQEDLRRGEQRLVSLLNMLPGCVVLVDGDSTARFVNHKFLEVFGEPEDKPVAVLTANEARPAGQSPIPTILATEAPSDWEWTSPEGRTYHVWGHPFADVDGTAVVLMLGLDITEQKRLERQVIETGESERRAVGRDLHDSLGQKLSGLGLLAEGVGARLAPRLPEEAAIAEQIVDLARDAVAEVRRMSKGLDPVSMSGGGLVSGLTELCENTDMLPEMSCRFECVGDVEIDSPSVATHLYRVAQEAVNNALKHGQARRIDVRLHQAPDGVRLTVEDSGIGVDERSTGGMGMRTMRYRANAIGASLDVRSRPEGGTRVSCFVPASQGEDRRDSRGGGTEDV